MKPSAYSIAASSGLCSIYGGALISQNDPSHRGPEPRIGCRGVRNPPQSPCPMASPEARQQTCTQPRRRPDRDGKVSISQSSPQHSGITIPNQIPSCMTNATCPDRSRVTGLDTARQTMRRRGRALLYRPSWRRSVGGAATDGDVTSHASTETCVTRT